MALCGEHHILACDVNWRNQAIALIVTQSTFPHDECNPDFSPINPVLCDLARDIAQGVSVFPHRHRCFGDCFRTPDFHSKIFSVGTVLSAASSGSRTEPTVRSCRDGAKYPFGCGHVAHRRSRHHSQWADSAAMSVMAISRQ